MKHKAEIVGILSEENGGPPMETDLPESKATGELKVGEFVLRAHAVLGVPGDRRFDFRGRRTGGGQICEGVFDMSGIVGISYDESSGEMTEIFEYRENGGPLMVMCARCGGRVTVRDPVTCACGNLDCRWAYLHRGSKARTYAELHPAPEFMMPERRPPH